MTFSETLTLAALLAACIGAAHAVAVAIRETRPRRRWHR